MMIIGTCDEHFPLALRPLPNLECFPCIRWRDVAPRPSYKLLLLLPSTLRLPSLQALCIPRSATVLPIAVPLPMVQLSAMAVVLSAVAVAPLSAAVALSARSRISEAYPKIRRQQLSPPKSSRLLALEETFLAFYWLAHRGLRIVLHVQIGAALARLERRLIAMTQVHVYVEIAPIWIMM